MNNRTFIEGLVKVSPNYTALKKQISDYIKKNNITAGIYFKDIATNTTFGINEDMKFTAASTVKVPIVLYLYKLAAEGKVDLNTKITYNKETDFESGGVLDQIAKHGDKYTLKVLAHLTITTSDNISNRMIMKYLGKDNIIRFMKDIGGRTVYPGGKNITTAKDLVTYMEAVIAFSKAYPEWGKLLLDDMANSIYNTGLPAKLPDKLYIPHKEGEYEGAVNDFGIVYARRPYILAILTSNQKDVDAGFLQIAEISRMIYDFQEDIKISYENEIKDVWENFTEDKYLSTLKSFFDLKSESLLKGKFMNLDKFFDLTSSTGKWACEHEQRRVSYVNSWVKNRNVKFTDIKCEFRIVHTEQKADSTWIYLVETMSAKYKYNGNSQENFFGIGIRHAIEMVNKSGQLLIKKHWYIDPLDEDTVVRDVTPALGRYLFSEDVPSLSTIVKTNLSGRIYNREQAVRYADLYNGGAYKTEKKYRYNQKYRDYSGVGGDCTNFVSQCLGDPEGGGLPMDYVWYYRGNGGSRAWVQADILANYLIYNGKGSLIARGKYDEVVNSLSKLQKGDLIAYEEKGDIAHFAIITGMDNSFIPVVNSHTSDRYHVPWDLGWDKNTVFWFIHING